MKQPTPERCWYCRTAVAEIWCDFRQLELGQEPPEEVVETCDVAACRGCARRHGWRQILGAIVCVRGGRGRGCHRQSIDHCHLHAAAENRGNDAWLGAAGVALLRAEARSACVLLAGGTGR